MKIKLYTSLLLSILLPLALSCSSQTTMFSSKKSCCCCCFLVAQALLALISFLPKYFSWQGLLFSTWLLWQVSHSAQFLSSFNVWVALMKPNYLIRLGKEEGEEEEEEDFSWQSKNGRIRSQQNAILTDWAG